MSQSSFYGPEQAAIHDEAFGDLAAAAARYLADTLRDAGISSGTIVDLGCGSGILARMVSYAGHDVVGVDLSADMVDLARERAPKASFVVGSVHDAAIPPAVAVTAIGEVCNYATDARAGLDALARLARRVRAALAPGGVFLFDVATPGRAGPTGARQAFHDRDDWSMHVDVTESGDHGTLERRMAIFLRTGPEAYRRVDEHHVLRLYKPDEVVDVLTRAGFAVEVLDGYGNADTPSTPTVGWNVFVARATAVPAASPAACDG